FGAVSRKRFLRNDVRLEADELQPGSAIAVAALRRLRRRARANLPRLALVNVGAKVKPACVAHHYDGTWQLARLCILAGEPILFQDFSRCRSPNVKPLDVGFDAFDLGLGLGRLRAGDLQIGLPRARL